MNLEGKRLTREELYEEVWRAPLTRLAAEWGVSPSAIVQACEEMNVPRPGSGHWTFIRRGWAVPRPDLPGQESGTLESVVIKGTQPRYGRRSTGIDTRSIVKAEVPCIPVHKELNVPHPLVAQMRNVFKEAKLGRIFSVRDLWPSGRLFRVQVSTAQVTRTLCILDALVKALEKRGAKFEPKHDSRHLMELRKDGETVDFLLSEEMEKRERIAKDEDERRSIWWTKSEYFSTGRLRFVIDGYAPAACKKKWADCSDYRLEEKVGGDDAEYFCRV